MSRATLLLNASYEPMKILSWQKAVSMWFADKVEIVEEYEDFDLRSMSFTMKCPAVVRLIRYVKGYRNKVKFSRVNVFARDEFKCQYCRKDFKSRDLTYDHVQPRSRGGKTTWTNIVTACFDCNSKKADRTPREARMPLFKTPVKPKIRPFNQFVFSIPKRPEEWLNYLYWEGELENDN